MKKIVMFCAAVAAAVAMTGCTSVDSGVTFKGMTVGESNQKPLAQVNSKITGFYLLGFVPLVTGSAVSTGKCAFFMDNVNVNNAVGVLCKEARGNGANRLLNLSAYKSDTNLLLFSWSEVQASATAVQ